MNRKYDDDEDGNDAYIALPPLLRAASLLTQYEELVNSNNNMTSKNVFVPLLTQSYGLDLLYRSSLIATGHFKNVIRRYTCVQTQLSI